MSCSNEQFYDYDYETNNAYGSILAVPMNVSSYFVGGFDNSNDVFYFGLDIDADPATNPNATVGEGQMYAFQLPVLDGAALSVTPLGAVRGFQSNLPPLVANQGLNLYWSVARSQIRCWAGEEDVKRLAFDVGSINSVDFTRSKTPPSASAKAPPVVTSGVTPFVYGASAANEIFSLNFDCSVVSKYVFPDATTVLTNKVLLSPDESYLFAATPTGKLLLFDAANLGNGPTWTYPLAGGVAGEVATSLDGVYVYVADVSGNVRAIQVSDTLSTPTPNVTGLVPTLTPAVSSTMPIATGATIMPSVDDTGDDDLEPTTSLAPSSSPDAAPLRPGSSPVTPPVIDPSTSGTLGSAMACLGALAVVALTIVFV